MRLRCPLATLILPSIALAASTARAELTDTIVQARATTAELEAAGYARAGVGSFVSNPSGECAVNGCFELVGTGSGTGSGLHPRGFLEFRFNNYTCTPAYYSGCFALLDLDFSASAIGAGAFIAEVNAQSSLTGITAMTAADATNIQGGRFLDWLPPSLADAIVLRWMPATPPSGPGLSEAFVIAWDLHDTTASTAAPTIHGVYAVPAPGALALVSAAVLRARRRR